MNLFCLYSEEWKRGADESETREKSVPNYARDRVTSMAGLSVRELVEPAFLDVPLPGSGMPVRRYIAIGGGIVEEAEHVL